MHEHNMTCVLVLAKEPIVINCRKVEFRGRWMAWELLVCVCACAVNFIGGKLKILLTQRNWRIPFHY